MSFPSSIGSESDSVIGYEDFLQNLTGVALKRANEYNVWVGNVKGIMHVAACNKFSPMQTLTLADSFSQLVLKKYDLAAVMKLVAEGLTPHENPKTLGSFKYYLKEDNPELYNKLYNKVLPYDQVKKTFEKSFFKVISPLLYVENEDVEKLEIKSRKDFINAYENKWCEKTKMVKGVPEVEKTKFVPQWLQDPSMKTYRRVEFCPPPTRSSEDFYNMFKGFKAERSTADASLGDVQPFLNHARVIAGNDDKSFKYLIDYFADIIQFPGRLSEVAIVLRGEQGAGKNLLFH
jgi:hypothetical protein